MTSSPVLLSSVLVGSIAVLSLVPAALFSLKQHGAAQSDSGRFWLFLAVALCGSFVLSFIKLSQGWQSGFGVAIWVSITVVLALFAGVVIREPQAKPIGSLLFPYLLGIGFLSSFALGSHTGPEVAIKAGTLFHVVISISAYGLITLSAVAALSSLLKEWALKTKSQRPFIANLPPISIGDRVQIELLMLAGIFLTIAVITGVIAQWDAGITLDHKSLLSIVSLIVVAALLFVHFRTGLRGRRAARFGLGSYLLLTLAYPGVKFVTDVLLG